MNHQTALKGDVSKVSEVVAQALFNVQFPMRTWSSAREYIRKLFLKRAEKALKLSGFVAARLVREDGEDVL